jgi:hypothetical protein
MRTKRFYCIAVCLFGALLLMAATSGGQTPPAPDNVPKAPPVPDLSHIDPSRPAEQPAPQPQTIDQMLKSLADIRLKKAELEKQEQALIKTLRAKAKELNEQLTKMGVIDEPPPPKPEDKQSTLIPPLVPPPPANEKNFDIKK